tara:strand:+ start:9530 stop:10042 length:513 start_codon:yes stop_codon:yes gene_type:complete
MSTVLFITNNDLKRKSIVSGNVDPDKFIQYIKIAMDIHIENYLGTKLYVRMQELIESGDILNTANVNYLYLLNTYIKPMTIHWGLVEYLPFAAYQVSNHGVYKKLPEASETVNKNEVDYLVEKERTVAQHYTRRCIDYLCVNSTLFPEYYQNNSGDVYPDKESDFGGWAL